MAAFKPIIAPKSMGAVLITRDASTAKGAAGSQIQEPEDPGGMNGHGWGSSCLGAGARERGLGAGPGDSFVGLAGQGVHCRYGEEAKRPRSTASTRVNRDRVDCALDQSTDQRRRSMSPCCRCTEASGLSIQPFVHCRRPLCHRHSLLSLRSGATALF